ncbi:uncharacterized protein [Aegilops tauschii subsp. strangulata]|uniref:Protein TolB n=2 Tax=Aegilops tauschii TaxID=37682 RepID=A0A453STR7_AEGTS|nr:uncharacterized protein LOC109786316 [Aegilops tauschii subsp. strangulata]
MVESRSTIAFFGTFRPAVALDLFSVPVNPTTSSAPDEQRLTDGKSYNQNGQAITPAALKELLARNSPALAGVATPDDVDKGRVTGIVFVSERDNGLETLHVALCAAGKTTVVSLADIYGTDTFGGVRMEDSGCLAGGFEVGGRTVGHSLVYVSTKQPAAARRTPWTVVYKTNLADGRTERLTPPDQYDLNPAVSPSGKRVAVANFRFNQWTGEIGRLKTDIVVMNVDRQAQGGLGRSVLIKDGGWPTWGSDTVIFFHRGVDSIDKASGRTNTAWGVYRYDLTTKDDPVKVTPDGIQAMTPAAISETKVAVAVTREGTRIAIAVVDRDKKEQYRHIEIYDYEVGKLASPVIITHSTVLNGFADHYSPFVLDGGTRVGFHRCITDKENTAAPENFSKLQSPPTQKDVGIYRMAGVFPSINKAGTKITYVDNEFKTVWVADEKHGPREAHKNKDSNKILSTTWNQGTDKDTGEEKDIVYFCVGTAFSTDCIEICALEGASELEHNDRRMKTLTNGKYNNAFPSSNKDGTKLVFRSTRNRMGKPEDVKYKNLYIMEDADEGEWGSGTVTQLTDGPWTDSHCTWSPTDDWIVFSSSRDRAPGAPDRDILDAGFFSIFLVLATDPSVLVRVMHSADSLAGHVCHPVFSPFKDSIVVTSDIAGVSADPVSLPIFIHSVRPYGDIFTINLRDKNDIMKNKDIMEFDRITHTRYEYSTPTWTKDLGDDLNNKWKTAGRGAAECPAGRC